MFVDEMLSYTNDSPCVGCESRVKCGVEKMACGDSYNYQVDRRGRPSSRLPLRSLYDAMNGLEPKTERLSKRELDAIEYEVYRRGGDVDYVMQVITVRRLKGAA